MCIPMISMEIGDNKNGTPTSITEMYCYQNEFIHQTEIWPPITKYFVSV